MRKNRHKRYSSSHEFWQSYSDMMAALLLMFVLIMAFTLAQSLRTFEEQRKVLEERQQMIDLQQEQIGKLIGVKSEIINELSLAFKDSDLNIKIDPQTGAITLDSSILFALGSSNLSKEGQEFVKEFFPQYISALLSEEYKDYIAEIIIEGHTDTKGTFMFNLALSQDRAYEVAKYCLDERKTVLPPEQLDDLRKIITANGRSYSNPIYNEDGTINADESRRVEIKFRLKDEEMIQTMQEILDGNAILDGGVK